jgi:C4-type Zn-finger protein
MEIIDFEFTLMDYLTECPYRKDIFVGEYDCSQCKYHRGFELDKEREDKLKEFEIGNYSQYFFRRIGKCTCSYKEEHEKLENNS